MIRYTGTMSTKGEARFLLDDADDVKSLPLGEFTWGGKTYQKPLPGSIALVEETGQRYKFDGTAWKEAGGGVSSWNDLTDKPFYESFVEVVTETEMTGTENADLGGFIAAPLEWSAFADTPEALRVEFDGVVYDCPVDYPALVSSGIGNYGNMAILGMGENTGEPFFIVLHPSMAAVIMQDTEAHLVRISKSVYTKLDHKYTKRQFYIRFNDSYLYTDPAFTVKATITDVGKLYGDFTVAYMESNFCVYAFAPTLVNLESALCADVTVLSGFLSSGEPIYKNYYTAEYMGS